MGCMIVVRDCRVALEMEGLSVPALALSPDLRSPCYRRCLHHSLVLGGRHIAETVISLSSVSGTLSSSAWPQVRLPIIVSPTIDMIQHRAHMAGHSLMQVLALTRFLGISI